MNGFTAVLDKKPGLISRVFLCLRELAHHVVPDRTPGSQPSAAPTLECAYPVGAAEGCDLLIF
jgi:hypothetical protein